jgi:hypothetical protein
LRIRTLLSVSTNLNERSLVEASVRQEKDLDVFRFWHMMKATDPARGPLTQEAVYTPAFFVSHVIPSVRYYGQNASGSDICRRAWKVTAFVKLCDLDFECRLEILR